MLRRSILFLTSSLFLIPSAVLAQDVLTVAGGAESHKVLLDNAAARMLDVRIQPGQFVEMHTHPTNSVYYLTDCSLKITGADGKIQTVEPKAGTAIWRTGETKHAVENIGTAECHLVQTELKDRM